MMHRRPWPIALSMVLVALSFLSLVEGVRAADAPTSPTLSTYRILSSSGQQLEVWLAGQRVGFTPLTVELPEGNYAVSASAESVIPWIGDMAVKPASQIDFTIQVRPLTTANYDDESRRLAQAIVRYGSARPHLALMALHMVTDPKEGRDLVARTKILLPNDPMLDALHAQVLLKAGELDEALAEVDRAVARLGRVAFVWRVRAEVLLKLGDFAPALDAANQAVLLDPAGWRSVRIRSRIHEAMGNERAAEIDREQADLQYKRIHEANERFTASRKAQP
jgi:tetratricopeptide (TPR) repeat protein